VSNEKISFFVSLESNLYIFLSCQNWIIFGSDSLKLYPFAMVVLSIMCLKNC